MPFDASSKLKAFEGMLFGVVGIVSFFSLLAFVLLIAVLGEYMAANVQQLVPPANYIRYMRYFLLVLTAFLMGAGLAGAIIALWQYTVMSIYGKFLMIIAGTMAAVIALVSYFVFTASFFRSKFMLWISGFLLTLLFLGLVIITAVLFWTDNNREELKKTVTEKWEEKVIASPDEVCTFQDAMKCSGFTGACYTSVGLPPESMPDECPGNCDSHNQNTEPCWTKLERDILSKFQSIAVAMVFIDLLALSAVVSAITLGISIHRRQKQWLENRKKRAKAIGGNDVTVEDVQRMKNCLKEFEKADVDGSGTLTMEEMHHFLESSFNKELRQDEFQRQFKKWDVNGDGVLSLQEFKTVFISIARAMKTGSTETCDVLTDDEKAALRHEFNKMDKDGSGTLDKEELKFFYKKALGQKLTDKEVNYYSGAFSLWCCAQYSEHGDFKHKGGQVCLFDQMQRSSASHT